MSSVEEQAPLFPHNDYSSSNHWDRVKKTTMIRRAIWALSILTALFGAVWFGQRYVRNNDSLPDFSPLEGYCKHISPIQPHEYAERHKNLARTLREENAEALIMEGGASMIYYTNIEWGLTERAFMIILRLNASEPTGIHTTIVTPAFEATRALKSLEEANMPEEIQPTVVEWLEYKSPFDTVKKIFEHDAILGPSFEKKKGKRDIIVEQNARLFIYEGLSGALVDENDSNARQVLMAPRSIRMLRMVKSRSEIEIMRCANTVTELAIRTVRPHIKPGMTEFDIQEVMTQALETAGLTKTWVLALVDENAALPHGGSSSKKVTKHSTVLIDTGGEFLGYQSDITRTFFTGNRGYNQTIEEAWYLVRRAQENVLNRTGAGMTCAQVDLTARHIIMTGGYGEYFTHRLGHGLGLEMHEEPYMNQGNVEQLLAPGMTFSVEPGIYITNEFGIRLEDSVVVGESGKLELLSSGLAQNPWTL